jgi:hypothetical protein
MIQDPPSSSDSSADETNDRPVADQRLDNDEALPPPPSPEAIARLKANPKPDYASSAAMVKDILGAGPVDRGEEPEEEAPPNDRE